LTVRQWCEENFGAWLKRPNGHQLYKIIGICHHKVICEKFDYRNPFDKYTGIDIPIAMHKMEVIKLTREEEFR
jgi:hypothetical protein